MGRTNATAGFSTEQKDTSQRLLWPVFFEKLSTVEEWAEGLEKKVSDKQVFANGK